MSKNFLQQLHKIEIEVDKTWQENAKSELMAKIAYAKNIQSENADVKESGFKLWRKASFAWQPIGILSVVIVFALSSVGAVVVRADNAMPGDRLFAVKRIVERTQGLTKLNASSQVAFAGIVLDKRVTELAELYEDNYQLVSADQEPVGSLALAVREVRMQMDEVDERFEKIKNQVSENNEEIVKVASGVSARLASYSEKLNNVRGNIKDEVVGGEIDDIIDRAIVVQDEALAVMVGEKNLINDSDKQAVELSLETKVNRIKKQAEDFENEIKVADKGVEGYTSETEKIKSNIDKAEKALREGEYELVLTLSNDSNNMLEVLYGKIMESKEGVASESVVEKNEDGQVLEPIENVVVIPENEKILSEDVVLEEEFDSYKEEKDLQTDSIGGEYDVRIELL